jgi:hypothetical protein
MKLYDENNTCWVDVITWIVIAAAIAAIGYGGYLWIMHFMASY